MSADLESQRTDAVLGGCNADGAIANIRQQMHRCFGAQLRFREQLRLTVLAKQQLPGALIITSSSVQSLC